MNADNDGYGRAQHEVRHIRNVRIPARDGTRLAADLFVPRVIAGMFEGANAADPEIGPGSQPPSGAAQSKIQNPKSKIEERFPALLEYLPYRKDDFTAARWDA